MDPAARYRAAAFQIGTSKLKVLEDIGGEEWLYVWIEQPDGRSVPVWKSPGAPARKPFFGPGPLQPNLDRDTQQYLETSLMFLNKQANKTKQG